jgi:uncharacterized membrane protein HdeD (DUF308 family)
MIAIPTRGATLAPSLTNRTALMETTVVRDEPGMATGIAAQEKPARWWLPATLGVAAIAFGIALPLLPDASLRAIAVLFGIALVLGGIARLRSLVTEWLVLATILAVLWLFSGLALLVIATTTAGSTDGRLVGLGVFSTIVGIAFAVWPRG